MLKAMQLGNLGKNFGDIKKQLPAIEPEKVPPSLPEKTITMEEIAELEEPVKNIIEKIKSRIEKGEYGLIISDDASGRIPALILGGVIKKISKLRNVRNPNIIFIPGRLKNSKDDLAKEKLQKHLDAYGVKKGERILIITEAIMSGKALSVISRLLEELGFETDIATMGIEEFGNTNSLAEKRGKNLGQKSTVISGNYVRRTSSSTNTPLVYRDKEISGVYKKSGNLTSQPIKLKEHFFENLFKKARLEHRTEIQQKINTSRAEVGLLVDKLFNWYLSQSKAD